MLFLESVSLCKWSCHLWYLLGTCSFLNAAHVVQDDGFAGVKRHWRVDGEALVADAANDQAARHILHFSSEHSPGRLTWTLVTQTQPLLNHC